LDSETAAALVGLFVAAFGAATLLPFQSEIALGALLALDSAPRSLLLLVASTGNTLGSVVNYWLGLTVDRFEGKRWFPASPAQMARARAVYRRWGVWTLLLSWAPFADVITLIAGVLRTPFWLFLLLVGIAKTSRYIVVIWLCDLVRWC